MRRIVSQVLLFQSQDVLEQDSQQAVKQQPQPPEIGLTHYCIPFYVYGFFLKQSIYILDAILDSLIYLPIRLMVCVFYFVQRKHNQISKMQFQMDLVHFLLIWSIVLILNNRFFEIGLYYHIIRGQSQIKLYGIIQILDLLDRLACNQGDYIFRNLYWQRVNKNDSVINRYLVYSFIYLFIHTCLLGLSLVVYNVIFSSGINLLYLALFVLSLIKLKGSVFKKQDEKTCLAMVLTDGREFFQKILYVGIIYLSVKFTPNDFLYKICFYFLVDILVDSFKFIQLVHLNNLPFNFISNFSREISDFSFALTLQKQFVYQNMALIDAKDLLVVTQIQPQAQMKTMGKLQFIIFPHVIIILNMSKYIIKKYMNKIEKTEFILIIITIVCFSFLIKLLVLKYQRQSKLYQKVDETVKATKSQMMF